MEEFHQSPVDPGFVQNPYPTYARMRAMGDFVYWVDYDRPVATTYAAVNAVMKHRALGREVPADQRQPVPDRLRPFYAIEDNSMLELEPPRHTRLRQLVLRAFTRNRVASMAPAISRIADNLISWFPSDPFDALDLYASRLPIAVISRLLGVPDDMGPQMLKWSHAMVGMYQARRDETVEAEAAKAAQEFSDYVSRYIEQRRRAPRDDLISELIAAEGAGDRLSNQELISTCILLLNAGHEATVHSIGNALRRITPFPGRKEALAPDMTEGTVEECMRFDPPLHMFSRYVYRPVSILDAEFQPGTQIGCLLGSACRDDAIWSDGDKFDPFRISRPHLAFGAGIHFCVGAPLARLEMQIALPLLFARYPNLRIVEEPKVANLYHFRGLEKLMMVCE